MHPLGRSVAIHFGIGSKLQEEANKNEKVS